MAFFEKNKVKIYYEVYGDTGPCLVFINGFTRPCQDFRMIARFFEGQGFRVLIFDNRGAGQTEYDTFTSLEQPADDLSTLLIELALESAHIVGFSMGGIIARCFANKYPGLLRSLTLVASPFDPSFISKKGRSFLGQTEEEIEKNFAVFVADDFYEKNKILFKTMARGTFKSLNTLYKKAFEDQSQAIAATKDHFYEIPCSVSSIQILHGDQDRIIPLDHAHSFKKKYPDASLSIFSGAGHLLLIEKSKELYQKILSFVKALD